MSAAINGQIIRKVLLEVINDYSRQVSLRSTIVLPEVARRLDIRDQASEEALLTLFQDLFRNGHLSWGLNIG